MWIEQHVLYKSQWKNMIKRPININLPSNDNWCTKETVLIVSDVDVNMFPAVRSIPYGTTKMNLRNCILNRHKMRVTKCDKSGILAVAFCDLSHFVIMAVTAQTESNNTENVFWVLGRVPMFTFGRNLRGWVLTHFRIICHMHCIFFTKHEVSEWTSGMYLITLKKCSRYLGLYCCKLLTSFWDFGFEPLPNCLSAQITCEKNTLVLLKPCKNRCDKEVSY